MPAVPRMGLDKSGWIHFSEMRVFRPECRSRSKQRITISAKRQLYFLWQGRTLRSRLIRARARRILSETVLLAIYLLLFAWRYTWS